MNPIEAARAALSRAMEGSDRTAVTEAARRLGFVEGVEAAAEIVDSYTDRLIGADIRRLATGAGDAAEERDPC